MRKNTYLRNHETRFFLPEFFLTHVSRSKYVLAFAGAKSRSIRPKLNNKLQTIGSENHGRVRCCHKLASSATSSRSLFPPLFFVFYT